MVGAVFAQFARDFVLAAASGMGASAARLLSQVASWSILVFVILAALSQLGIAQDLVRILFTGFIAMLAIAGGLAFGLGGRETAQSLLEQIYNSVKERQRK